MVFFHNRVIADIRIHFNFDICNFSYKEFHITRNNITHTLITKIAFVRLCLCSLALELSSKMFQICKSPNQRSAISEHTFKKYICLKLLAQLISIILNIKCLDWIDQSILQRITNHRPGRPQPSVYMYL